MSSRPSDHSLPSAASASPSPRQLTLSVSAADGSTFELLCVVPAGAWRRLLVWLPAMGVSARQYLALAEAMAARGVAVAIHEWRGIGSSDRRADRTCNWGYRELLLADLPATSTALRMRWPGADVWLGGHSLGGQLGALYASLHPGSHRGLALVASGAPYWRCFRRGAWIGAAYLAAPGLATVVGHLPGRRIGFGGNEARGVIADWARSGRTGTYTAAGIDQDFERRLAELRLPLLALRLSDDWLGPAASLEWLLRKMPLAPRHVEVIGAKDLGGPADHFGWMKTPVPIADRMIRWMDEAVGE
jgi:predicted alpha/beta hydrolase